MGVTLYKVSDFAERITTRMAQGESLRSICRDPGMPSEFTVRRWAVDDTDGFASQYARAREAQAHALADQLLEIADDGTNDWMQRNDPDNPGYELNGEHVQRSRLRLDARKWLASKILPKQYGEKMEHAAADGTTVGFVLVGQPETKDSGAWSAEHSPTEGK